MIEASPEPPLSPNRGPEEIPNSGIGDQLTPFLMTDHKGEQSSAAAVRGWAHLLKRSSATWARHPSSRSAPPFLVGGQDKLP